MKNYEDVKAHVRKHQKKYIIAGAVVGVGVVAAGGYILGTKAAPQQMTNVSPKQILTWKSTQNVEVYIEALGDPGNIIQDVTTGTIYASQGQAAKALSVHPARVTEHLKGVRDHIDGHILTKLGKAGAELAVPTIAE